jgi:hypothetical protein
VRTYGAVRGVLPRYRFWMITVGAWNSATKLSATVATRLGCRISPRRRPFVVDLSNHGGAAHIDSAYGRVGPRPSTIVVVALSNALDLCDSLRQTR